MFQVWKTGSLCFGVSREDTTYLDKTMLMMFERNRKVDETNKVWENIKREGVLFDQHLEIFFERSWIMSFLNEIVWRDEKLSWATWQWASSGLNIETWYDLLLVSVCDDSVKDKLWWKTSYIRKLYCIELSRWKNNIYFSRMWFILCSVSNLPFLLYSEANELLNHI